MGNQRLVFSIFAITLGLMLLGSVLTNSTPLVFADHNEDKKKLKDLLKKLKAKIQELLDVEDDEAKKKKLKKIIKKLEAKIQELQDEEDEKCKEKKKYQGECDLERPEIEIEEPEKGDKLPAGMITIEIEAEDEESGIKKVEVRINRGPFLPATQVDDDEWEFKVNLVPGKYKVTAKATDFVNNKSRDSVKFKVVP